MKYLLLALLCAGCGTSEVWYADERFTADEEAEIQKAVAVWPIDINVVYGAHVSAYDTDRRVIVKTDRYTAEQVSDAFKASKSVAATHKDNRILIVPSELKAPMWYVMAHEFGHTFNMDHVEDPSALMYGRRSTTTKYCLTKADMAELARVTGVVAKGCDE